MNGSIRNNMNENPGQNRKSKNRAINSSIKGTLIKNRLYNILNPLPTDCIVSYV